MQLATIQPQNTRIGSCPHGLPAGACPICSGMGGGGAKKADFSAKPGEMSWNECAAIGAFLRAQKAAHQAKEADFRCRKSLSICTTCTKFTTTDLGKTYRICCPKYYCKHFDIYSEFANKYR